MSVDLPSFISEPDRTPSQRTDRSSRRPENRTERIGCLRSLLDTGLGGLRHARRQVGNGLRSLDDLVQNFRRSRQCVRGETPPARAHPGRERSCRPLSFDIAQGVPNAVLVRLARAFAKSPKEPDLDALFIKADGLMRAIRDAGVDLTGARVLDIACDNFGYTAASLRRFARADVVEAFDLSEDPLHVALAARQDWMRERSGIEMRVGVPTPEVTRRFDAVTVADWSDIRTQLSDRILGAMADCMAAHGTAIIGSEAGVDSSRIQKTANGLFHEVRIVSGIATGMQHIVCIRPRVDRPGEIGAASGHGKSPGGSDLS